VSRTPLASRLSQAASVAAEAVARDISTEQVIAERAGLTRREVIVGGTGLGARGGVIRAAAASAGRHSAADRGRRSGPGRFELRLPAQAGGDPWKVGQYTKFAGREREIQGACHFCGEHTSIDFQG
jgi:hypothetical protein